MSIELVAIGDSFVEGRGDDLPRGGYRGWVNRFGQQLGLRPAAIRNLGTHGATTREVLDRQLPPALGDRASLYAVVCGVNDLVSDFDRGEFESNVRTLFTSLRATGSPVLTANYPDIPARLPVPNGFRGLLRERFVFANATLAAVAAETGTLLLDLAGDPVWAQSDVWTSDGLHPSSHGHSIFATTAANAVTARTSSLVAA